MTATCPSSSSSSSSSGGQGGSASISVTVVAIDKVIVADSNPENPGPVNLKLGFTVDLLAKRLPAPATGPWPSGHPKWTVTQAPNPFAQGRLLPSTGGRVTFSPDTVGTWKVKAECCDTEDEIEINVTAGCGWISNVSADKCYERVDTGPASSESPINIVSLRGAAADVVTLTVSLATGGDPAKVSWVGATQDPANPLKATVPIGTSTLKKVTVKYDGVDCREILVWPVWASVTVKVSGNLSGDNKAPMLTTDGHFPENLGGGTTLGSIDIWTTPGFTYKDVGGKVEAVATLSPPGVGDILPMGKVAFRRRVSAIAWENGGKYIGDTWHDEPTDSRTNFDDTSVPAALDVNPAGNDQLFDIDVPGLRFTHHTGEMYANFTQYVTFNACGNEELCSNEAPWSYRARVDYDKPTNKVELNEPSTSHITLPTTPHYSKR